MPIEILSVGSKELEQYIEDVPKIATDSIRMAINTVARGKAMTRIKKAMTDEIAFPTGYLSQDRLKVVKVARGHDLEAIIVGRKRATSLARFVTGGAMVTNSKRPGGVQVRVKRGKTTVIKNAFLVRLNKGASVSEDGYNIGLAVRLSSGEQLANKRTQHQSWLVKGKVALLYAPSVDQVFRTVAPEEAPRIADDISAEFHRNFARLSK